MAAPNLPPAPITTASPHQKPFNTLILDSGPIIKNNPSISTLVAKCDTILTIPEVLDEIRDAATRERVNTLLKPFLTLRSPSPASVKFVIDFARRTGDLSVLSKTDLRILALAYEVECEVCGGDWRLKKVPGQKDINGPRPVKSEEEEEKEGGGAALPGVDEKIQTGIPVENVEGAQPGVADVTSALEKSTLVAGDTAQSDGAQDAAQAVDQVAVPVDNSEEAGDDETTQHNEANGQAEQQEAAEQQEPDEEEEDDDDDDEGWITPSNIKRHQAAHAASAGQIDPEPTHHPVATLTTDFAMQNVLLQINLTLISESLYRIKQVKTTALRCYACFNVIKDLSKQFCPRCGKPSLTRVSCSTDAQGGFKVHLKKGYRLNTRGDRYSIPKPATNSASGRVRSGGGTGGWGSELILAEDQKEYVKAVGKQQRTRERDLMNEDFLPGIISGERMSSQGKIKVGAGRSINSMKRKK